MEHRVDIIELKEEIERNLKYCKKDYKIEFIIPLTESWAYYKDNDPMNTQEWLIHITCPKRLKLELHENPAITLYCWTEGGHRGCTGCGEVPSKASVNKKEILSKIAQYAA